MFCKNCGTNIGDAKFCPNCGTASQGEIKSSPTVFMPKTDSKNIDIADKVKNTFESMTGGKNDNVVFKLKDLWSDVIKKHSKEESELLLITGTGTTTPSEDEIEKGWSKPWLYSRIFAVLGITFALLLFCVWCFENTLCVPGLIFIGAMMMPFTLLILFWETNIPRNISVFELLQLFFVGGVASLVFTLAIFSFIPVGELNVLGAIMVGIIEEVGKLIAVAIFIKHSRCKYILNGILIGAAIGTGFAVFESAGYALMYTETIGQIIENILMRGLLSAGGHVVWAAMSGAAIMFAKGDDEFSMKVFTKAAFWKLFPVPIVLHALWDMPFSSIPVLIILTVIAWIFILALIRSGMGQINEIQKNRDAALVKAEAEQNAEAVESTEPSVETTV